MPKEIKIGKMTIEKPKKGCAQIGHLCNKRQGDDAHGNGAQISSEPPIRF
jgi:hypothetical protein